MIDQRTGDTVRSITLSEDDIAQVKAILLTHAEMTDQHSMQAEADHGRAKRDMPGDLELIEDLKDNADDLRDDTDNLKRIAALFD